LLARSSAYSSGNWTSHADYYADGNGNVTSLIDANQAVVASYRYDPFGNVISKSGTLANANVYRFSSKEMHVNSGMYYYGFRFYDPNLQRWINRDPIAEEGGINVHAFVENSPFFFVDLYGLILRIDPNARPSFRDHMKDCIQNLINNSETGRKLVQEAIDSKYTITISPDDDAPRTEGSLVFPAEENRMPTIYMYPKSMTGWNPRLYRYGKRRYPDETPPNNLDGCSVTLAHELGHALYDYNEPDNVPKIENPVRNDFHLNPRKNYRGKQVVP